MRRCEEFTERFGAPFFVRGGRNAVVGRSPAADRGPSAGLACVRLSSADGTDESGEFGGAFCGETGCFSHGVSELEI